MKLKRLFPFLVSAALLAGCSPATQSPQTKPVPEETDPKVTSSPTAAPETSSPSATPTVSFTPKANLSEAQNSFVKQVMEKNHYNQRTAELVLGPAQSLCGLLDTKQADSAANKKNSL